MALTGGVGVKLLDLFRKREQGPEAAKTERAEIAAKTDALGKMLERLDKLEERQRVDELTIRGMSNKIGAQEAEIQALRQDLTEAKEREVDLERRLSMSEARNISLHAENEDLRRGGSGTSPPDPTGRHAVMPR